MNTLTTTLVLILNSSGHRPLLYVGRLQFFFDFPCSIGIGQESHRHKFLTRPDDSPCNLYDEALCLNRQLDLLIGDHRT